MNHQYLSTQIQHLYRHEYGKLVSILTNIFGVHQLQLVEDVVQEAMLEALEKWSYKGVPSNQVGWIYQVAKNKAVNLLKRQQYHHSNTNNIIEHFNNEATPLNIQDHFFSENEITDDQLRMMFTCCHPSISADSQIALILKTLCGFSIPEIAKAFITTEENINKRLVRARKIIRELASPFEVPSGPLLTKRLQPVLESILLLFNEGYLASNGNRFIKKELCEEAIRLTEILLKHQFIAQEASVHALLSFMLLSSARFDSRIDEYENIIELQYQDRKKWNQTYIQKGLQYLNQAISYKQLSSYHVMATISAHYCTSKTHQDIDWKGILALYNHLEKQVPSPITSLNRAIVIYQLDGAHAGLDAIESINKKELLFTYLPYYIVKAEFHFKNNEKDVAIDFLESALQLPMEQHNKQLILDKIALFNKS